jgi:type III pantothenate kinase
MADQGAALLIDIGNSRIKWAWARQGRIEPGEPFATRVGGEEFPRRFGAFPPPAQIAVANVAGAAIGDVLKAFAERQWGLAPQFAYSQARACGVVNGYDKPEKLGVDRWVGLIGARHATLGPCCVADCGTAITFDALDADGKHLGGLIAPGLSLMRTALAGGTHGLGLAEDAGQSRLARDTAAAIAAGTRQAAAGLIEHAVRETARRLGGEPRLLLTGGDAPAVGAGLVGLPYELKPELVLEGLLAIAQGA